MVTILGVSICELRDLWGFGRNVCLRVKHAQCASWSSSVPHCCMLCKRSLLLWFMVTRSSFNGVLLVIKCLNLILNIINEYD